MSIKWYNLGVGGQPEIPWGTIYERSDTGDLRLLIKARTDNDEGDVHTVALRPDERAPGYATLFGSSSEPAESFGQIVGQLTLAEVQSAIRNAYLNKPDGEDIAGVMVEIAKKSFDGEYNK